MGVHKEQVATELLRRIQEILGRGLNDPRVRGLVSVTKVNVSDDMANATVFVSILPVEHTELTMHGLRHAGGHFRYQLSRSLGMRRVPRLTFKLDETLKKSATIIAKINESLPPSENEPAVDSETPPEPEESGT